MNKKMLFAIQISSIIIMSGALGGMFYFTDIYEDVEAGIVKVLCLSCIKLQPITSREFTFKTANGKDHPDFIKETLRTKGPVFIQYSEPSCPGCEDMIRDVMKPYFNINFTDEKKSFETKVTVENISFYFYYIYIDTDDPKTEKTESFWVYDKDKIRGFPMFTIITIEYSHSGEIKPYYTSLYGDDFEDTDKKKYETFIDLLEFSKERYNENIKAYK